MKLIQPIRKNSVFYNWSQNKGQHIKFDFDLYEDVDAAYNQQLLNNSFPVALRLLREALLHLSEFMGEGFIQIVINEKCDIICLKH
ncbi:unnamed protein product [Brassica napus]|uniref:(rape) hypothetical protein n=1 Tax=Brassica napus TaxID=3708 RepID=A0A816XZL1_BRANA|nr:unnamed protein product [Brassica napus]